MGREVRKVPGNWEHPKNYLDRYEPLESGYTAAKERFLELLKSDGYEEATEWFGGCPYFREYMPEWPEEEKTHFMMYETTSEGTPISPAFKTPEELAKWLAENKASSFGKMTATYEQWLAMITEGYAPSGVYTPETGLISGVEASGNK